MGGSPVVDPAPPPAAPGSPADSDLVRAARGLPVRQTPVWFMRQAGRSLPEYRALRAGTAMLEACQNPDLVTEITLQPVRRHGVDAAILFSDIVLPLVVAGIDIEIKPGGGPVGASPVRSVADVDALPDLEPDRLEFLRTAVRGLVAELGPTPLIGFAGAPFTLATYLIEGGPSKEHARTKAFMYAEPAAWSRLLDRLAVSAATFLGGQVDAGASAVQLFDSWAGVLSAADYAERVLPHSRAVFDGLGDRDVPRIHFGVGTGELLALIGDAGADVVGVDWRGARGEVGAAWPGGCRWTRRPAGWVRDGRCRGTSTPLSCSPTARRWTGRCAEWSSRGARLAGTSSISATACSRRPIPACSPTSRTWCTS